MSKKAALLLWLCLGLTPISAAQLLVSGEVSPINEIIIEDMAKAKVLHLMARPYQSITRLRSRLMMAPRDAELWKNLDEDWIETLFPRIMMGWVTKASQKSGLEPSLILSVIRMESTFNTEIKSRAGASGLMQLMPMTARHVAQHLDIRQQKDEDLLDPETNVMLGSFYLAPAGVLR